MTIKVNIKQLGSKRDKIAETDFHIDGNPQNLRELITASVHTCVTDYNTRAEKGEDASPISSEDIRAMSEIGKIAFGINYGGKKADEQKAERDAVQAYEDGLFRIFIDDKQAGGLDEKICLTENTRVTFIRLTMLTGRLW